MSRLKSPKLIAGLFEPTRVFIALLIAAIIWLYPAIIGGSERQQDSTIESLIAYPPPLQAFVLTDSAFATDSDSPGRDCGDCYEGCTAWDKYGCNEWGEICDPCSPPPPVYSPPTISAVLYCSQSVNGWCTGSLSLNLTASDPQGKAIVISGTLNGTIFALPDCPVDPNLCWIPISSEGAGTITYRVESATGLAASGATNYQLDSSTPALNGSLSGTAGINGWYRSNVILNITASDSASGIASTETNTNNAGWTTYRSSITFTDGIYTVAIRTTDKAGYTAQTSQTIQVDSITPTLSTSLSGTSGLNGWYVSNVTITPTAGDPSGGSGLASFEVNVDEGGYIPYSSPILFTDGIHTYQFKASDKAGNVTETAQKTVKVDTLTPSVSTSLSGTSGLNGWFVSNVSITPAVSDPSGGSGLAAFVVSTEGSTYSTYVNPLFFSEGVHTYRFRATDHAGNVTETVQQTVRVDTTTPTISLTITGTLRESGWYVTNVTVTPVVNDLTAGIGSIESSLEGGAWSSVISPPSFSDGLHSYQFKVTDNAGNSTIIPVQNLKIDTIAPAIDMTEELSLGETMVYNLEDHGSGLYIYRAVIEDDDESNEKITWLDDISGNKRMQGQILWDGKFADGAKASWGFNTYFITLKISDIAGNETMKSAVVSVNPLSFLQDIPVFVASQTTTLPAPVAQTESASSTFGGENNPSTGSGQANTSGGGTITTNEGGENNNNINGTEAITTNEGGASLQWTEDATIESGFGIESVSTNTSPFAPSNILWGAAATALLGATLADWQRKREEEARVRAMSRRERLAAEAGPLDVDDGNTYGRIAKAYQASLNSFKATLVSKGLSPTEANAYKTQAIVNGSISSVAGAAQDSVDNAKTNQRIENKMAKLDAVDEAKWTASQAVIAQREKEADTHAAWIEKQEAANATMLQEALAAQKALEEQRVREQPPPKEEKSWWQKISDGVKPLLQEIPNQWNNFTANITAPSAQKGPILGSDKFNDSMFVVQMTSQLFDIKFFDGKITQATNNMKQSLEDNPVYNAINNSLSFGTGATFQYLNDMSFGLIGNILHVNWENGNDAFQTGMELGRTVSTIQGVVEIVTGAATAAFFLSTMPPTGGLTVACGATTAGFCLPFGIGALTVEGAGALAGGALATHGVGLELSNANKPLQIKGNGNSSGLIKTQVPGKNNTIYRKTKTNPGPALDYEVRVTGKFDPDLAVEANGVEFDWYDGDTLIDAKNAGESRSWYDVSKTDKFTQKFKVEDAISRANKQLNAMEGTGFTQIEWRVADLDAANALRKLFKQKGISIIVEYYP